MAFIDVLVNVLDCFDGSTDFNIDVTVILGSKIGIVRDNVTVGLSLATTTWHPD
jgi:hypothetical protein